MSNPYKSKGPAQFWHKGVADLPLGAVTPAPVKRFEIEPRAVVATAGSCFAQNVAQYLRGMEQVRLLVAEPVGTDQPLF